MQIRTRFAPSPTGMLHIGGARTALFSWLYARHNNGKFVLRIEDTDIMRSTKEAINVILAGMEWLGLDADEGPFYQTNRMERYKQVIERLLNEGKAYRCYCSKERIDDLREKQLAKKEKPRYDGLCRRRDPEDPNQPFVIRFKNPDTGIVSFDDQVHGTITIDNRELDDLIIARSDGTPTYNFCVVVDDLDMGVTHVVRGDDHINNTPRQINLIEALGERPPVYAHLPMILGPDGTKLSKRHGAVSVLQYREEGILPAALLNYLVRLGWSHGDKEIFSIQEMIELFDIKDVNKAASAINPDKLLWLNQHYMKTNDPKTTGAELVWHLKRMGIDTDQPNVPKAEDVVKIQAERCHTLVEMAEKSRYFYEDVTGYEEKAQKNLKLEIVAALQDILKQFKELGNWSAHPLHEIIIKTAEKHELKLGKIAQPIRVAITGGTVSPPIDVTLEVLGKDKSIVRIQRALDFIEAKENASTE